MKKGSSALKNTDDLEKAEKSPIKYTNKKTSQINMSGKKSIGVDDI